MDINGCIKKIIIKTKKIMSKIKDILGVLFFISILICVSFVIGRRTATSDNENSDNDTIIYHDTIRIPFEKLQTQIVTQEIIRWRIAPVMVTDTFVEKDTVIQVKENVAVIPIMRKEYTDSATYRAVVSGYDPRLDEIEIYRENMIVTQVKKERRRWAIGATAGAGIGLFNRQPDVFVGVGVTYNITP